jgi:hypothetical protein
MTILTVTGVGVLLNFHNFALREDFRRIIS